MAVGLRSPSPTASIPPTAHQPSDKDDGQPVRPTAAGKTPADRTDAVSKTSGPVWIKRTVKKGDTLTRIFRDHQLDVSLLQSLIRDSGQKRRLASIRPGDSLHIRLDENRDFDKLILELDALRSIEISSTKNGVVGSVVERKTDIRVAAAAGIIEHSLFSAARNAGLQDSVTMALASIFGWDIDFALEIRAGDKFSVIYQEFWADGERLASGDVLAAEFVNGGRKYRAVRYKDNRGKVDYYTPDGRPMRKLFFRTPVEFSRISSGFSKHRWHPVLKRWRAHKGVDYAAPTGTPVMATGDGEVLFRGWKKGYGRVVYLRHGRTYQTVYGHLARFANGLHDGDYVKQGQVIGYVGQSGMATGPHLHYEFHVAGKQRNPLAVKAPIGDPLAKEEMRRFRNVVAPLLARLDAAGDGTLLADAR
jgi:murein DD-endopeptidase MepM/ murein hydrolase activator NlpD